MKWLDESLMQLVTFGKLVRKYIERKRLLDTTSVMQTNFVTYLMKESNCPCNSIFITRMKSFDKQWNGTGSIYRHLKQKLTNFFATKYEFKKCAACFRGLQDVHTSAPRQVQKFSKMSAKTTV